MIDATNIFYDSESKILEEESKIRGGNNIVYETE